MKIECSNEMDENQIENFFKDLEIKKTTKENKTS